MSELSHPTTEFDGARVRPESRETWMAAILLAALAGLTFTLVGAMQLAPTPVCKLHPRPMLMPWEQAATAISRGGAPCLIAANNSDARVEALEIVSSPNNGWIATRGKTALVYFPNSEFKGVDSFELKLVRRTDTSAFMTTNIIMKIKVE